MGKYRPKKHYNSVNQNNIHKKKVNPPQEDRKMSILYGEKIAQERYDSLYGVDDKAKYFVRKVIIGVVIILSLILIGYSLIVNSN